jgi:hypothetical protein
MSRNGTGTYNLPAGNPVVTGTVIASTWANSTLTDIASALTGSVAADGQTPMTGDLDMNTNKITNVEPGTVAGNAIEYDQFVAATTTAVNITGGTIDGTPIGNTTRSSGKFTTLDANGATTLTSTLAVTGVATFAADSQFNGTGALKIPVGTTAQQPTPATGMIRYNSTLSNFEGYYASSWIPIGGVAGGSNTQVQYNNAGALAGSSAFTFNGTTLTVPKIAFASSNTPSLTNYQGGALIAGTAVASTSGTSIDFTSIPSWVNRVTFMFDGISTTNTVSIQVQFGTSSGIETSGYISGNVYGNLTSGFVLAINPSFSYLQYGTLVFTKINGNSWVQNGCSLANGIAIQPVAGSKTLSGTLDRLRLTTTGGIDTFDAGTVNILYE